MFPTEQKTGEYKEDWELALIVMYLCTISLLYIQIIHTNKQK